MIDWSQIKTIDDVMALDEDLIFDLSREYDADEHFKIADNLTADEREDAEFWSNYRRGVMLVTGAPGQGKGIFIHMLGKKFKRYFGMPTVTDTRPRKLYGKCIPFSTDFIVEQLDRAYEVMTGQVKLYDIPTRKPRNVDEETFDEWVANLESENERLRSFKPHITDDGKWISSRGEVLIRRVVMLLDEFGSRYMYKKEPNAPITRVLLKMFTLWRHMQSLIVGVGTERSDFNPDCFEKVTCEIRMQRLMMRDRKRLLFGATLYPLRYISSLGELTLVGKPIPIAIDADEPREMLNGGAWKDLFNTDSPQSFEPPKSLRRKQ